MTTTIALYGAAGKMGTRITAKLRDVADYSMLYVEAGEAGVALLAERGLTATGPDDAASQADVVILAVPDTVIGRVTASAVPRLKSGAMVICLDPAAPYGGELAPREDITYFVVHPCHPPLINDETDPEARADFFGGVAKQHIVCALMQGPESDYCLGVEIARRMFAPVLESYRVTVEQMAILEPALAETTVLTCLAVIREAVDEAIHAGVPEDAVLAFVMGHMRVTIGILFNYIDAVVSDGAKMAMARGRERLFRPDWKRVFEIENVLQEVKAITQGIKK
jgi:D-apionate oxidoisomerase